MFFIALQRLPIEFTKLLKLSDGSLLRYSSVDDPCLQQVEVYSKEE